MQKKQTERTVDRLILANLSTLRSFRHRDKLFAILVEPLALDHMAKKHPVFSQLKQPTWNEAVI